MDAAMQFQEKGEVVWKVDGEEEWTMKLPDDIKFNSVTFKQVCRHVSFSELQE